MNIPDEVMEEAARVAWSYEPGASVVEFDRLNPKGRAELIEIAKESTQVVAVWARGEALREAAAAIEDLTEAIRLTVEYVGIEILPPLDGWSWYEALRKYRPDIAAHFLAIRALAEGDSNERL